MDLFEIKEKVTAQDKQSTKIKIPYVNFNTALQQISGILPIDYYFAKELTLQLMHKADSKNVAVFFHLLMALSESLRNGHTCLPLETMAKHCLGFACDQDNIVSHHGFIFSDINDLTALLNETGIMPEDNEAVVFYQDKLYIRRYFTFESELSTTISERLGQKNKISVTGIQSCLDKLFSSNGNNEEIDWQKVAVANALNKNFSVIAGGPGTGKTYTVTKLLAALVVLNQAKVAEEFKNKDQKNQRTREEEQLKIALVAPTGKAAQRLSESIGKAVDQFRGTIEDKVLNAIPLTAQTLHRLLGVIPNSPNFRHHQENLLSIDVLLIDEVSMVDLALLNRVFRALPKQCKVVLLGDADQLPSVAAGSVLSDIAPRPHPGYSKVNCQYLAKVCQLEDLIKQHTVSSRSAKTLAADHITYLIKSRRFDNEGGIGQIAKAVINGQSNDSWNLLKSTQHDSSKTNVGERQLSLLAGDYNTWLPALIDAYYLPLFGCQNIADAFSLLNKFRILCATRKGECGVESYNEIVKDYFVQKGKIGVSQDLYHAKPIMISENDYRLGLYNGDIGLIWKNEVGHLMAVFEGSTEENNDQQSNSQNLKWIMPSRLPCYESVYAMTIHKTQGSEFNHVALILPKQTDNKLLSRELLYTGITRAKENLSVLSNAGVWRHAVEAQVKRDSGFSINPE